VTDKTEEHIIDVDNDEIPDNDAPKKIRMGTLHFWAMEDNNQKYKDITEKTATGWVLNYPDATHVKVAELVKRMYRYEFCCTMVGRKDLCYFQYGGNFWKKLKSNNELRARLTNRIVRIYLLAQAEAAKRAEEERIAHEKSEALRRQMEQLKLQ
jgi:hypothetical protein